MQIAIEMFCCWLFHFSVFKSLGGDCLASLISVAFQNHVISWSSCWSFLLMEITVVFHKLLFFTELNWAEKHRLGTEPTHFSTRFLNMFCYFLEISVFNKDHFELLFIANWQIVIFISAQLTKYENKNLHNELSLNEIFKELYVMC